MSEPGPFEKQSRPAAEPDLSDEISQSIDRELGQRVTCRRISGSNYRCNWWSPKQSGKYDNPRMEGLLVTTHVVARSRFISASKTEHGLTIKDVAGGTCR